MIVDGNMWVAAVRGIEPIVLSVGALITAIGLESKYHSIAEYYDWP